MLFDDDMGNSNNAARFSAVRISNPTSSQKLWIICRWVYYQQTAI
jgi:hypothetical protein